MPHRHPPVGSFAQAVRGRSARCLAALTAAALLLLAWAPHVSANGICLRPPVPAPVVDPFRAPSCAWCPGNRGIDYATAPATAVTAAAGGRVTFAGAVAGVVWVTVDHGSGLVSTYGPMARLDVGVGDVVRAGHPLGTVAGRLHFGVREQGRYIDPVPLLGAPVHLVPRLVALDRPVPPPPRCSAVPVRRDRAPAVPAAAIPVSTVPAPFLVSVVVPASASLDGRPGPLLGLYTKRPILPAVVRRSPR